MRIGLNGGAGSIEKMVEQAQRAEADGFSALGYPSAVARPESHDRSTSTKRPTSMPSRQQTTSASSANERRDHVEAIGREKREPDRSVRRQAAGGRKKMRIDE